MDGPVHHWKLGLFVVVAIGLAVSGLFWLGAARLSRDMVRVLTYFDESVQGLDVGSPVKIRGVTIGHVSEITIAEDQRHVEVHADIYQDALVRLGLRAPGQKVVAGEPLAPPEVRMQLASAGITGNKFLQLDFFDPDSTPAEILPFEPPWNAIPAAPSTLKSLEGGVLELMDRLPEVLDQVRSLAAASEEAIRGLDAPALAGRLDALLARLEDQVARLDAARLSESAGSVLERSGTAMDAVHRLAGVLEQELAAARLAETTASLRNATEATVRAAEQATGLAGEATDLPALLDQDLVQLRRTLEALEALARLLERDPGVLLRGRSEPGDER